MKSQSTTGNLQIIDVIKNHPKKEICIQDVADIEYIALETTDDVLLSDNVVLSCISDNYILLHEPVLGNIFLFHRTGKIAAHFNHKGQSGWEYALIGRAGTIFDEKKGEIFVCSQYIQVYSMNGEHKRTLKINTIRNETKVFNFDDESLLVVDGVNIDPYFKGDPKTNPYSLVSKKDGSLTAILNISLPKRYSNKIAQPSGNGWRPVEIFYPNSMFYGRDFIIADISCDTMFLLTQNKQLAPILTREPSVHSSDPRKIWTTLLNTDRFIVMGIIPLVFNSRGGKIPFLIYEFDTGQTSEISFLDVEYNRRKWSLDSSPAIAKNMYAELMQVPPLLEAYKKKQLSGEFEKFVETLDEDDNPIVRIMKFK